MHLIAPLLVALASVSQTVELEPTAVMSAVKLSNYADELVHIRYRASGDPWTEGVVERQSAHYIYRVGSVSEFDFRYWDRNEWQTYRLPTGSTTSTRPDALQPDMDRHDEAQPYFFKESKNRISIYSGFEPQVVRRAAAAALAEFRKRGTPLELFRSSFDPNNLDPLVVLTEFEDVRAILSSQFRETMHSPAAPGMELAWEEEHTSVVPRMMIFRCDQKVGADFLKDLAIQVLRQVPGEYGDYAVAVCWKASGIAIRGSRLNLDYIRDNGIDIGAIRDDVVNHLRKNSLVGTGAGLIKQNDEYFIFGDWKRIKSPVASPIYYWRMRVSFSVFEDQYEDRTNAGIRLRADVQGGKRYASSGKIYLLTTLAVAELPNLPETVWSDDESNVDPRKNTADISPAARLCRDVETGLEALLVKKPEPSPELAE